jgi:hypothetical protein
MAASPDAAALRRGLAAARVAVQALQAAQRPVAAVGLHAPPPPARPSGAVARDAGVSAAHTGGSGASFAVRRRRPAAAAAAAGSSSSNGSVRDAPAGGATRSPWSTAPRRQRPGKAVSLESAILLDGPASGEDDEGSDAGELMPAGDDPAVDRAGRAGEASSSLTPRWFANAGKTHTYYVRALSRGGGVRQRKHMLNTCVCARGFVLWVPACAWPCSAADAPRATLPQVVRIDKSGATFTQELKRRELLRETGLPARDLRRIDPALSLTTSAPTLLVSDSVLLINLGQVRRVCACRLRGCAPAA